MGRTVVESLRVESFSAESFRFTNLQIGWFTNKKVSDEEYFRENISEGFFSEGIFSTGTFFRGNSFRGMVICSVKKILLVPSYNDFERDN